MKNFKIYTLLAIMAFFGLGCSEFLDENPRVQVVDENFYLNDEDAIAGLFAAYDPLQYQQLDGSTWHFRWVAGDIVSDDSDKGGSDPNDQIGWFKMENFEADGGVKALELDWQKNYIGIFRVNVLLTRIEDNPNISEETRKLVAAEAKFLRAFYYFDLVKLFGGVPIVIEPLAPSEYQRARNTLQEVYDQVIEEDLLAAIPDLPTKGQRPDSELGRVTKGAAQALLAKAYVFQQEWAKAEPMANEVINSGEYSLSENYENIFLQIGEHGPGSIFEINFSAGTADDWGANALGSSKDDGEGNATNQFQRARGIYGGWGFNIPTQGFVDEFETNDPRLESTIFQVGDEMGDRGIFTLEDTGFPYIYYPKKYFIGQSEQMGAVFELNGPSNEREIRYSDVLLWHAEAAYHNGNEAGARVSVNTVRERARRGTPAGTLPDVTASGTALLDAIYHERRVELGLEGHRFYDLTRTGRAGEIMRAQGFNFIDGVHELFPIPTSEITASGNKIIQNNGYN